MSSLTATSATSDGAQGQCLLYNSTDPRRAYCIACYASVLASKCPPAIPAKTDPSQCTDPVVRDNFVYYVNQCVNTSVVAGFSCTTVCSSGQTLVQASCTCVSSTSSPITTTGGPVDVGQHDYGPPVVTAQWPTTSPLTTVSSPLGGSAATRCVGQIAGSDPIWLSVQNRGDTVPRSNVYAVQSLGSTVGASNSPIAISASNPSPSSGGPIGTNAYTTLSFASGGESELIALSGGAPTAGPIAFAGQTGGTVGMIKAHSGQPGITGSTAGTGVYSGDAGAISAAGWGMPGFGARDFLGNLYFTDRWSSSGGGAGVGVIRVLCNDVGTYGGTIHNDWCGSGGRSVGQVYAIVGDPTGAQPVLAGTMGVTSLTLRSPTGIAVDQYSNIFFTDSVLNLVGVACAGTNGYCSGVGAGNAQVLMNAGGTGAFAGLTVSGPMGLDVQTSGGSVDLLVASSGEKKIKVACGFAGPSYCGGGSGTLVDASAASATTGITAASAIDDVKLNWNGNVFFTQYDVGKVSAVCFDSTKKDLCGSPVVRTQSAAPPAAVTVVDLAGTGIPGDYGDGKDARISQTFRPTAIALAKAYADDLSAVTPAQAFYRDNNVLFTEQYFNGDSNGDDIRDSMEGGNTVRMICGDNSTMPSSGMCYGKKAGTMQRVGGIPGFISGNDGGDLDILGPDGAFANLYGACYDLYKNVVVSSTSAKIPGGGYRYDNAIRTILYATSTAQSGVSYSFTDSNLLTSLYCMRFKVVTSCYRNDGNINCQCEPSPPFDPSSSFWTGLSSGQSCP